MIRIKTKGCIFIFDGFGKQGEMRGTTNMIFDDFG